MRASFSILLLSLMVNMTSLEAFSATHQTSTVEDREGWVVTKTGLSYDDLIAKLEASISSEKMGLVTQASASSGASSRGVTIPGNRVVGVFRNDFAVRMLEASVAAGIEAPIRFYITANPDNTATLTYKKPSFVFEPYMSEGGEALKALASELDVIFEKINAGAVK